MKICVISYYMLQYQTKKGDYYIMKKSLKEMKRKLLLNLKQEQFRKELNSPEYNRFSEQHKELIMKYIKHTNWELDEIRAIFQSKIIQEHIDSFLYLFRVLECSAENDIEALGSLSWEMICDATNSAVEKNGKFDFTVAKIIINIFSTSPSIPNYNKVSGWARSFVNGYKGFTPAFKEYLFESMLSSTKIGMMMGNTLFPIFRVANEISVYCRQDDFRFTAEFDILNKVYRGAIDKRPDLIELIEDISSDVQILNNYKEDKRDFWIREEDGMLYNRIITMFKTLEEEIKKMEEEPEQGTKKVSL